MHTSEQGHAPKWIKWILISVIPVGGLVLNVLDLVNVFTRADDYPFGSEFFPSYSIYRSQAIYVTYQGVHILSLVLFLVFAFSKKHLAALCFMAVSILLFLYPIATLPQS